MADSIQDQLARLWAASMPPVPLPPVAKPVTKPKGSAESTPNPSRFCSPTEATAAPPAPARTFASVGLPHRCRCAIGDWQDRPADNRPGWLRTDCRCCGRFIGYRPTKLTALSVEFEERAAIREFDGQLPRDDAERFAWFETGPHPLDSTPQNRV